MAEKCVSKGRGEAGRRRDAQRGERCKRGGAPEVSEYEARYIEKKKKAIVAGEKGGVRQVRVELKTAARRARRARTLNADGRTKKKVEKGRRTARNGDWTSPSEGIAVAEEQGI